MHRTFSGMGLRSLLMAFMLAGCGDGDQFEIEDGPLVTGVDESAIIGGYSTTGYPEVVEVNAEINGRAFVCSGTVVGARTVLTAAHCVSPLSLGATPDVWIFKGNNLNTENVASNWIHASGFIVHPSYNASTWDNDIALVRFASNLNLPVRAYNVYNLNWSSLVGKSARIVGFGVNNGTTQTGVGVKRQALARINGLSGVNVRIGTTSINTCQGDSGGPAMIYVNNVLTVIGVTSWGWQGCTGESYYARPDLYASWLSSNVR